MKDEVKKDVKPLIDLEALLEEVEDMIEERRAKDRPCGMVR